MLPCAILACSVMGVTVGQLLNNNGAADFYKPLRTCGDGVVTAGLETCDALPKQHPYASGCSVSTQMQLEALMLATTAALLRALAILATGAQLIRAEPHCADLRWLWGLHLSRRTAHG